MKLFQLVCVMLLLVTARVYAQDEAGDDPIMGSGAVPPVTETLPGWNAAQQAPVDGPMSVLVIGDVLAGGMGAGMTRMSESDGRYEILNRFNESSGIARPEFYDWADAVPKITGGKGFQAAVILIGSNDRQDIKIGQFRYNFGTPEWTEAYKIQVARLIDALKVGGLQVFWVSIPPMGDALYNKDMMALNDLIKAQVEAKGEVFVDIRPAFLDASGAFTDRGADETGTERKLRARDGVTFFKAGNNKLGQLVLAAIDKKRTAGPVAVAPVAEGAASVEPTYAQEPVLGQTLGNGDSETIDSTPVSAALEDDRKKAEEQKVSKANTVVEPVVPQVKIIDVTAAPGSEAAKFLATGIPSEAPAGRFDDFSYVAVPAN
jgi:uncharacterized protein